LVGVFDPAQRYMARRAPHRRGRRRRRPGRARSSYAALTSDGRGGSVVREVAAPPPEFEELVRRRRAEHEARLERVYEVHADALRAASGELATSGRGEIATPGGAVSARVRRFRWGSSVLEIETRFVERRPLPDGDVAEFGRGMSSRSRIRRTGEEPATFLHYLASALAELDQHDAGG
jgi:hypothetical protein